ncbi:MAG: hypothetical protein HYW95_03320 [Candidatus Wildermuthbacteria bacterium]|nr:hypothetical protein [Candidatus Wildermuthbacteria bacterium]
MRKQLLTFLLIGVGFLAAPHIVDADILGQKVTFFIDQQSDAEQRERISATLQFIADDLYFYTEDSWWNSLDQDQRNGYIEKFRTLGVNFQKEIYPTLTNLFGTENRPGIDKDALITILIHPMKSKQVGGYVRSLDGHFKLEAPTSNEREMLYLSPESVVSTFAKSFLAHEFTHLIYFNQNPAAESIEGETWFAEGFAELAPTFVGYDAERGETYLKVRQADFVANKTDSLTEWSKIADYGVVNIFFQYLKEQYGSQVLLEAFRSSQPGILAVEEALEKNGIKKSFDQIFTNWTIALFLNDCSYGKEYCFEREELSQLRVAPYTSILPTFGDSSLTITNQTKDWAGNWHKVTGRQGFLKISFEGNPTAKFVLPYLLQKQSGSYELQFLPLSPDQKGEIQVKNFGKEYIALIIIPTVQTKRSAFTNSDPAYFFSWTASITGSENASGSANTNAGQKIQELLRQIELLQAKVRELQAQLTLLQGTNPCSRFESDLFFGLQNNSQVRCLQQFLKSQGPAMYPEGLVTGNFLFFTKQAVINFQEKYASEILTPLGLSKGTGFVGQMTRKKINEILGYH